MAITATQVKELRDRTGAGMMDCKKALQECGEDMDKAIKYLKEKGMADAVKRSDRTTNEGLIITRISNDGKKGYLIRLNCETDFVARTDQFQNLAQKILEMFVADDKEISVKQLPEKYETFIKENMAILGENMQLSAADIVKVTGENGQVVTYIHGNGRVGVLVAFSFSKTDTATNNVFLTTAKDIAMHIAASSPVSVDVNSVPEDIRKEQEEIYAKQAKESGKPDNIIANIIKGRMQKYYKESVLLEQMFVKDTEKSVKTLLEETSKNVGDHIGITGFVREKLGE